ncbi:unnamed protein product (macronuclear) [Paramecium tetraurelia]|uniref:Uncharacterized protein n=1 Tax=Paramecium tetraurelia TaxID=5888 RepID=A0ECN7_PARTE|nr:uncharacterized protein GSPATT00003923001 [Paramecium tetraurelia]CAK93054.1 unnamed protein product [Paramecium tetraurelia]|eukprot:XP_001460451.1 hypothetical protein (macronuclear) [Paramecium tetraurelia strain d4-2]
MISSKQKEIITKQPLKNSQDGKNIDEKGILQRGTQKDKIINASQLEQNPFSQNNISILLFQCHIHIVNIKLRIQILKYIPNKERHIRIFMILLYQKDQLKRSNLYTSSLCLSNYQNLTQNLQINDIIHISFLQSILFSQSIKNVIRLLKNKITEKLNDKYNIQMGILKRIMLQRQKYDQLSKNEKRNENNKQQLPQHQINTILMKIEISMKMTLINFHYTKK